MKFRRSANRDTVDRLEICCESEDFDWFCTNLDREFYPTITYAFSYCTKNFLESVARYISIRPTTGIDVEFKRKDGSFMSMTCDHFATDGKTYFWFHEGAGSPVFVIIPLKEDN